MPLPAWLARWQQQPDEPLEYAPVETDALPYLPLYVHTTRVPGHPPQCPFCRNAEEPLCDD